MPTICVARAKGERIRYHTRLIVCKNVYDPSGQQKRKEKQHSRPTKFRSEGKTKVIRADDAI